MVRHTSPSDPGKEIDPSAIHSVAIVIDTNHEIARILCNIVQFHVQIYRYSCSESEERSETFGIFFSNRCIEFSTKPSASRRGIMGKGKKRKERKKTLAKTMTTVKRKRRRRVYILSPRKARTPYRV